MPIKQPKRQDFISNLADVSDRKSSTLKVAGLFELLPDGTVGIREVGMFLLNPSTWTENKSANWAQHQVPGQSDPILQYMSSGPRTVNFTALVTADTSDYVSGQKKKPGKSTNNSELSKIFTGSIASAFAKTTKKPERIVSDLSTETDISSYLNYYRSLLYPEYNNTTNPTRLTKSPPLVVLFNGSAINKYPAGSKVSSQHDMWVVTNLQIRVTKQHPNLSPLEAEVDFSLMQYNIKSFSRNRFLEE